MTTKAIESKTQPTQAEIREGLEKLLGAESALAAMAYLYGQQIEDDPQPPKSIKAFPGRDGTLLVLIEQ